MRASPAFDLAVHSVTPQPLTRRLRRHPLPLGEGRRRSRSEATTMPQFRHPSLRPALPAPAARRRAGAPCAGRRLRAGEAGTGARRRARLDRRGAHVARPEARDRARRAARGAASRSKLVATLEQERPLSARKNHAGASPDALDAGSEILPRHALRGRQPHRRAAEVAGGRARPRPSDERRRRRQGRS